MALDDRMGAAGRVPEPPQASRATSAEPLGVCLICNRRVQAEQPSIRVRVGAFHAACAVYRMRHRKGR
jgi:hypothetical protein